MRAWIVVIAAVVIGLGAFVVWRLRPPNLTDEQQIAQIILDVKEAVETKDARGVLKHISEHYNDRTFTKRDITRMVVSGFTEPEPFSVHVEPPGVTVQGDRASARVHARFARGPLTGPAPETDLDVRIEFARESGHWRVVSATGWEPAVPEY